MDVITAWTRAPLARADTFPLNDDHSPAFAQDHPVSSGIKGPGSLVGRPVLSGQPEKCAQGGKFHKMEMGEILLAPADDGCIDNVVADHLDSAVKCDQ